MIQMTVPSGTKNDNKKLTRVLSTKHRRLHHFQKCTVFAYKAAAIEEPSTSKFLRFIVTYPFRELLVWYNAYKRQKTETIIIFVVGNKNTEEQQRCSIRINHVLKLSRKILANICDKNIQSFNYRNNNRANLMIDINDTTRIKALSQQ